MAPQIIVGGIHLVNSTGAPVAGGTATAAATTPFSIRSHESGGGWPIGLAEPQRIMSGGPPFNLGSRLLYRGYDNVVETIPIAVQGSTHVDAVAKLSELKLSLAAALYSVVPLLEVKPDASSSSMYAEIYDATVRELPDGGGFDAWSAFDSELWAEITWVRAPFFSAGSLTTAINGLTYTNAGSSNNTRTLGTILGDLRYDGQPLNILFAPASGVRYLYAATVYQRIYNAGIAATTTTSSTAGSAAFNDSTASLTSPARTRNGLRLRVMLRTTSISAKAQVQISLVSSTSSRTLWRGPWVSAGGTGQTLIDATPSGVPLDLIRRSELGGSDVNVGCLVRSTDGTSVSMNLHSAEYLLYYTFCRIDTTTQLVGANDEAVQIETAHNLGGQYVPSLDPGVYALDTTGTDVLADVVDMRGTLPRAIAGASLYLAWLTNSYTLNAADTAVVTAKYLPLYKTIRGNG